MSSHRPPTQEQAERMLADAGLTAIDEPKPASVPPRLAAVRDPVELEPSFYAPAEADEDLTDIYLDPFDALSLPSERGGEQQPGCNDDPEPTLVPIAPALAERVPAGRAAAAPPEPDPAPGPHGVPSIDWPSSPATAAVASPQLEEAMGPPAERLVAPRGARRSAPPSWLDEADYDLQPELISAPVVRSDRWGMPPRPAPGTQAGTQRQARQREAALSPRVVAVALVVLAGLVVALLVGGGGEQPATTASARHTALPASLLALTRGPRLTTTIKGAPRGLKKTQRHRPQRAARPRVVRRTVRLSRARAARSRPVVTAAAVPVRAAAPVPVVVRPATAPVRRATAVARGSSSPWSGEFSP